MNTYKFKKLEVWQKSMTFITSIYKLTTHFPTDERFGLTDQIRRAAVSIALNISEGSGAGSDPEYLRFLRMSQRSAYEVITGLEIAINLKLASPSEIEIATDECDHISAMLGALIKKIKGDQSYVKS